ncbi:DUF3048 domain-containing protein [Paenibacillus senegalensis]|uniref:DUF3048 domain-containing protein n=1 Tax=Paenibacillus senegalensis TaxID=1465766 RepID=UPI000289CE7B|nr:DUF3048 domain-containing protein [Paenibacillus senegalensis]
MTPFNLDRNARAGKPVFRLLMLMMAVIVLTSCANANLSEQVPPSPTPTPPARPTPEPTPTPPPFIYPLTGIGTEEEQKVRPLMVMVENSPQARPQTGLDQADIVFEILAEGEITRFAAVYQSQEPEVIGPVRSIRPYYVEIGEGLDALIVHAGWSQEAINMIKSRQLAHFDQVYGDDRYYWRSSDRRAPNNLYTSVEKIREGAVNKKYREEWKDPQLRFGDIKRVTGESFTHVEIPYIHGYKVSYDYDEKEQLFLRNMAGEPHTDAESGVQLSAANVLIVEAEHRILDDVGRRAVSLLGSGNGYLLQAGKYRAVEWERTNGIIRAYDNGRELELIPGKTWIQVVPVGTDVVFENAAEETDGNAENADDDAKDTADDA